MDAPGEYCLSKRKIELLAPARDLACGIGAIDHGADAVYIGGSSFGARAAAGNGLADIEKLVEYSHRYFSRVYVALNTLLTDAEIEPAVRLIHDLYNIGIDGLIIQDMGLLECDLPPIPLHASTQCNNRTPEKVKFLEQIGFEQIVLARELGLDDIRKIRSTTKATLEFFVHGALCVSYSGQCYISEVMTGRSANRGECAQFCRHAYRLEEQSGKIITENEHVLSLKDLNLSRSLEQLIDAGIDSFKIEGRLKSEQYVKNVTAFYRQELDALLTARTDIVAGSSGHCDVYFLPDLARSFNRGNTDYYLHHKKGRPGATHTPKSTGQYVGEVTKVDKKTITLKGTEPLHNGDGCCYFNEKNQLVGFLINRVEGNILYPARPVYPKVGSRLFRNVDVEFNKGLAKSNNCRRINIDLDLYDTGSALRLTLIDEDNVVSETEIALLERVEAKKTGVAEQMAERQLRKSGESLFTVNNVKVTLASDLYLAASVCNGLRRQAFEAHVKKRIEHYGKRSSVLVKNDTPWLFDRVDFRDNINNVHSHAFYRRHGVVHFDVAPQDMAEGSLMHCKYCVRAQYGLCTFKAKGENADPLYISDNTGKYKLTFTCESCEMHVSMLKKSEK